MRLKQIQDFLAVVEAGSIHAAARNRGVSQPAMTKSIRDLEAKLHVQLVQRTNHGIVPTLAGQTFFARARVAHSELRKAEEEMAEVAGHTSGAVAFGAGPTATLLIVPDAIERFRRDLPKARIRVLEGFPSLLLPLVRNETLDFAIGPRLDGKVDPALRIRPLFRHRFVVVARKGHPLRNARSLGQVAEAEWISVVPLAGAGGSFERVFSLAGFPVPHQIVQCDSYNLAIGLLAKTDMVGICSHWMLTQSFARDFLQQIPIAEAMPSYTVGMFTRADAPLTRVASAMAKAVAAAARRLARPAGG
jgi:LysR family transcriptional regulator, regulator of abg operon